MTSGRAEGWGAVVNEAMNEGCVVVGGDQAGSVPYLISDGVNGMVFPSGNWRVAAGLVMGLLDDLPAAADLGVKGYTTIATEWNARVAATRLLRVCEDLFAGERPTYTTGPCSYA